MHIFVYARYGFVATNPTLHQPMLANDIRFTHIRRVLIRMQYEE